MSFEESSHPASSRYLGEGFRLEPDFREGAITLDAGSAPAAGLTTTTTGVGVAVADTEPTVPVGKRVPATNLDYVFDDPAVGEPGRDRMLVHGLWELVLVLGAAGVGYLLYRERAAAFSGDGLRTLLLVAATLGLITAAAALSLRAGVPNLAVGAVAVAGGLYYGHHADGGVWSTLLIVAGLAAAVGAVAGLVIVGLHVPSWAVTIAVGLGVLGWVDQQSAVSLTCGYDRLPHADYWFGGFCAVSVIAALVGLFPPLRRAFGRFRPVADPAHRRGVVAAVIVVAVSIVSTILAGVSGVLAVTLSHRAVASDGLDLTALAIGAALLGGTSAYGRRGGIFGTVFAVSLLTVVDQYLVATERSWSRAALAAVAIGVGLAVTRLVERFGRPDPGRDDTEEEDWVPAAHMAPGYATATTSVNAPTPAATAGGLWASDEAWGSAERR
jgi:ribose/xylose/arabinose/galactoside ABC-type transport system permease subunit